MLFYLDLLILTQVAREDVTFCFLAVFSAASIPGRIIPVYLSSLLTGLVNMIIATTAISNILAFIWRSV
jgi:hypothetical protein